MLYPYLHWMEDEGLIKSEWKLAPNGRRRKYYRLSRAGGRAMEQEHEQWLTVQDTLRTLWKNPVKTT
jgi:PadR family transcriptional regulator, regulatory protein PadR